MNRIITNDGTRIYFNEGGSGQSIEFGYGWPWTANAWKSRMVLLASHGFRCIAQDKRGRGWLDDRTPATTWIPTRTIWPSAP